MKATAKAHPIQGLVKYHGMRDEQLRLPYHDSISVCTAPSHTKTTAEFDPALDADRYRIDGDVVDGRGAERIEAVVDHVRGSQPRNCRLEVAKECDSRRRREGRGPFGGPHGAVDGTRRSEGPVDPAVAVGITARQRAPVVARPDPNGTASGRDRAIVVDHVVASDAVRRHDRSGSESDLVADQQVVDERRALGAEIYAVAIGHERVVGHE